MTKLFISYRSLDSAKVDALVARLRTLKHDHGTPQYTIWQDKTGIPDGHDWWESIVDAIIDCSVFVFMVSRESVNNINCRTELSYARKRNRPVVPLVLEGEFFHNPVTGKNDIDYWNDIPQELNDLRAQFLFYEGASFVPRLETAVSKFLSSPNSWRDIREPRPRDPRNSSDDTNSTIALYDEAVDYAWRMEFDTAERWFQKLVNLNDADFAGDAHEWILLLREYKRLLSLDSRAGTRYKVKEAWDAYCKLFPKPFITGIYDPKNLQSRLNNSTPPTVGTPFLASAPPPPADPLQAALQRAHTFTGRRNRDWQPFVATFPDLNIPDIPFCLVPVGSFQMGSDDGHYSDEQPVHPQTIKHPYWIAQYPVTNVQWALAVRAKAVEQPHDTDDALKWYQDPKMANAPVVGIDWFMARDFAAWLGCRLPTEREWEYAARGVESLRYPWGDDWNEGIPVWGKNSGGKPAVVTDKADGKSWVDVRHLIGNVWEWTNSLYRDYPYAADDREGGTGNRTGVQNVLRGGSWRNLFTNDLRAARRYLDPPVNWFNLRGVRVARS